MVSESAESAERHEHRRQRRQRAAEGRDGERIELLPGQGGVLKLAFSFQCCCVAYAARSSEALSSCLAGRLRWNGRIDGWVCCGGEGYREGRLMVVISRKTGGIERLGICESISDFSAQQLKKEKIEGRNQKTTER